MVLEGYTEFLEHILEGLQALKVCKQPLPEAPPPWAQPQDTPFPAFPAAPLPQILLFLRPFVPKDSRPYSVAEEELRTLIALPSMKPLDVPRAAVCWRP